MTWLEIANELSDLEYKLSEAAGVLKDQNLFSDRDLVALEPDNRTIVDAACRFFSKNGSWPQLTQQQAALAYVRLAYASALAGILVDRHQEFSVHGRLDRSKAEIFDFLLVDYWRIFGFARWSSAFSK